MEFPFELDIFQEQAIESIKNNNNVLVMAHTGSGKTVIAVYAIHHNLKKHPDKKVLFVSPIKSLSNEKFKDFTEQFSSNSVGILTGDNKINPDAEIIVITAEILRNDFYMNKRMVNNISCIIFDEVHYINDQDRGTVWEEILVMIDKNVQLVMLSATISKPTEFSRWLYKIKNIDIDLIKTNKRVIPLTHYIFMPQEDKGRLFKILDNDDTFYETNYLECYQLQQKINYTQGSKIMKLVNYLRDNNLLQTIVFSFSRNKCEQYANIINISLISPEESEEINNIFNYQLRNFKGKYEQLSQYHEIIRLMKKGIAYHHSGLVPILKEIVEIIFKKGLIKLLFATETFAVGVNMPTRTVVITDISKMSNRGKHYLNTAEYKQISGRAGRRGIDKIGNVILMPMYDFPEKSTLKTVMTGMLPCIQSKFALNYHFLIKSIRSGEKVSNIFENTLMSKEHSGNINHYKCQIDKYNNELSQFNIDINTETSSIFDKLIYFEELITEFKGFKVNFDKNQEKEYKRLKQQINNTKGMKDRYQKYLKTKKIKKDIEFYEKRLSDSYEYLNNITKPMISFLHYYSYISEDLPIIELNPMHITKKGNVGAYINECNFMLLTEIINDGLLDNLTAEEIIAVMAIFIEDKDENNKNINEMILTNNIKNTIHIIHNYALDFSLKESSIVNYTNEDFWSISTEFVEVAYLWAQGFCIGEIKTKINIYEGNFIKNITKINNIVNDIINSLDILNKIDLIAKLQDIEPLLIRDIVTVSSLYINKI